MQFVNFLGARVECLLKSQTNTFKALLALFLWSLFSFANAVTATQSIVDTVDKSIAYPEAEALVAYQNAELPEGVNFLFKAMKGGSRLAMC